MTRLIYADALLEALNDNDINDWFSKDFLFEAITNAPTVQREGWVSVEDRLPEKGEDVLVYAGWPITAIWDGEGTFYTEDGTNPIYHVSDWQYLPAAPTDKE